MAPIQIAPSILSADFRHLEKDISAIVRLGASYVHFDVMDGHFVPNISFGIPVLEAIARIHRLPNDVHIMIENPLKYVSAFIKAGADILTFHYEACRDKEEVEAVIAAIKSLGAKAGISVRPATPISVIEPFLPRLDLVLVMSVEPGFGGQSFMPLALDKIRWLREKIICLETKTLVEVDGGINEVTARQCVDAGADILVAGSYLFGHKDIESRFQSLLKL